MRGNVDGSATDHLLCSEANAERLRSSVAQMKAGDTVSVQVENLTMQGLQVLDGGCTETDTTWSSGKSAVSLSLVPPKKD